MKKIIALLLSLLTIFNSFAQEAEGNLNSINESNASNKNGWGAKLNNSNFHLAIDLQTKYLWRGMEMITQDAAPVIFPSVSYDNWGWNIYFMGGTSINGKYAEVDLGTSYTYKWLSVGLNDYYYPTIDSAYDDYFNYKNRETGHWLEATVTIAPERIPVYLMVSNFFAGADKKYEYDNEGNISSSKQAYSTYAEVGGHYDFLNDHSLSATIGCALNKSCYNLYEKGFSCTNVELKYTYNVNFKHDLSLPISVSYVCNPTLKKSHVNCTLHFGF